MIRNLILFLLCYATVTFSQTKLPAFFSDNMVLQQQSNVPFWGKSIPNKSIIVKTSWDNKEYRVKVNQDSTWKVKVSTPIASQKSYTVTVVAEKKITIKNVLIGEVWLCSGQSNMEMPMKGYKNQPITGALDDIVHSSNNNIRCFTVKRNSRLEKQSDLQGNWDIASPNTTPSFTATGYYFARLLQQVIQCPVGIIHSSWGGSPIESWMPAETLNNFPEVTLPKMQADIKVKAEHKTPTLLYNGMINPLVGFTIKGVIWYQGEANVGNYKNYAAYFAAMHASWNKLWNCGDLPIYFCQLAPHKDPVGAGNSFMREVQLNIAKAQPNTAMAVLMDAGDLNYIHPANKRLAGERLAYIALAKNYGYNNFAYEAPVFREISFDKEGKGLLKFDKINLGLTSYGAPLTGFELAGDDKVFYTADAKITPDAAIEVQSEKVKQPVAVRYAFKGFISSTLYGSSGLPVSSFRSDNWDDVK